MKTIIFLFLTGLSISANAQNPNKLTFEIGCGTNKFSMSDLNEFYIDSFAIKNKMLEKGISSGNNFSLGLKFKPHHLFDIGIYGNYQYGQTTGKPEQIITDDFGMPIGTRKLDFKLKTEAISIGVSSCFYISQILKFQEKENNFLNRSHFGLELNVGIGFSKVSLDLRDPEYNYASTYDYFTSQDFQGQIALKFEYDYIKSPIIGSIGIKGGYQYFKTKTVKDRNDNDWIVLGEYPINLDFSGFFGTFFLTIGK